MRDMEKSLFNSYSTPSWLDFKVLEGAMQAEGRKKTSLILPNAGASMLLYQPVMQDVSTGAKSK